MGCQPCAHALARTAVPTEGISSHCRPIFNRRTLCSVLEPSRFAINTKYAAAVFCRTALRTASTPATRDSAPLSRTEIQPMRQRNTTAWPKMRPPLAFANALTPAAFPAGTKSAARLPGQSRTAGRADFNSRKADSAGRVPGRNVRAASCPVYSVRNKPRRCKLWNHHACTKSFRAAGKSRRHDVEAVRRAARQTTLPIHRRPESRFQQRYDARDRPPVGRLTAE